MRVRDEHHVVMYPDHPLPRPVHFMLPTHFEPEHELGYIRQTHMPELVGSAQHRQFGVDKRA